MVRSQILTFFLLMIFSVATWGSFDCRFSSMRFAFDEIDIDEVPNHIPEPWERRPDLNRDPHDGRIPDQPSVYDYDPRYPPDSSRYVEIEPGEDAPEIRRIEVDWNDLPDLPEADDAP